MLYMATTNLNVPNDITVAAIEEGKNLMADPYDKVRNGCDLISMKGDEIGYAEGQAGKI